MQRAPAVRARWLRDADRDFVAALSRDAFGEYTRDAGPATLAMARKHRTLVAERDGVPLGFAVFRLAGARAELLAIAVSEHERGRGVGRLLLALVEKTARRSGARSLSLHTADANLAALELFRLRGFVLERRILRYYLGVFDAWELTKAL
jgi:ribosomal protein S18 acetylase RimI-like enzyme